MAIRDLLLPLLSYPNATSADAIRKCVAIGAHFNARITALSFELDVPAPPGPFLDTFTVDDRVTTAPAERQISKSNAERGLEAFKTSAEVSSVAHDLVCKLATVEQASEELIGQARLRDLTMVPIKNHDGGQENLIERLIFESGRPVLIFNEQSCTQLSNSFDHVAIAWDHSAQAARAIADALPFLKCAKSVRIFMIADDRAKTKAASGEELVKHLDAHGVSASFDMPRTDGSSIGSAINDFVKSNKIDLLVMGAYRHSRLREFILGGATYTILGNPPCWVMMSH